MEDTASNDSILTLPPSNQNPKQFHPRNQNVELNMKTEKKQKSGVIDKGKLCSISFDKESLKPSKRIKTYKNELTSIFSFTNLIKK